MIQESIMSLFVITKFNNDTAFVRRFMNEKNSLLHIGTTSKGQLTTLAWSFTDDAMMCRGYNLMLSNVPAFRGTMFCIWFSLCHFWTRQFIRTNVNQHNFLCWYYKHNQRPWRGPSKGHTASIIWTVNESLGLANLQQVPKTSLGFV